VSDRFSFPSSRTANSKVRWGNAFGTSHQPAKEQTGFWPVSLEIQAILVSVLLFKSSLSNF
jgi:hypothetical protein